MRIVATAISFPSFLLAAVAIAIVLTGVDPLGADDQAVREGRRSLQSDVDYPWYDPESDSLRRIDVPEREDEEEDEPDDLEGAAVSSGGGSSAISGFFQVLFWGIIILLFVGLVVALVWAFMRADRTPSDSDGTEVVQSSHEVDRIENLPFKIRTPQADLLAEAERHYNEGNYREAVIYLYSYELVELDKNHRIRLAKGKTNRQYLRELRQHQGVAGILERTMIAFEDVFFGHHELSRRRFEDCWNSLGQFRSLMGQGGLA